MLFKLFHFISFFLPLILPLKWWQVLNIETISISSSQNTQLIFVISLKKDIYVLSSFILLKNFQPCHWKHRCFFVLCLYSTFKIFEEAISQGRKDYIFPSLVCTVIQSDVTQNLKIAPLWHLGFFDTYIIN